MKIDKFKGLNTQQPAEELEDGEFRELENLYVTDGFKLKQRPAVEELIGGDFHSLYESSQGTFVVSADTLYLINEVAQLTPVKTGLTPHTPLHYTEVAGSVYFSNASDKGRITNGQYEIWGLSRPSLAGCTSSVGGGKLSAGRYMVYITYLLSSWEESPASEPEVIQVEDNSSLVVVYTDVPDSAVKVNIYMTGANGTEPRLVAQSNNLSGQIILFDSLGTAPLQTLDISEPPLSDGLSYFNGRITGFFENVLWYTEPLAYSRYRPSTNYYLFPGPITMVEAVDTGLFVGADQTYFLAGADMSQLQQQVVDSSIPVKMSSIVAAKDDIPAFEKESGKIVAMWLSNAGFMAGLPDGTCLRLTEDKVSFPVGENGSMSVVKQNGIIQVLGLLREPSNETNTFGVSDRLTAQVFRNGIQI